MPVVKKFQIESNNDIVVSFQECDDGLFIDIKGNTFEILNYWECNLLIEFLKEVATNMEEKEKFINELNNK